MLHCLPIQLLINLLIHTQLKLFASDQSRNKYCKNVCFFCTCLYLYLCASRCLTSRSLATRSLATHSLATRSLASSATYPRRRP